MGKRIVAVFGVYVVIMLMLAGWLMKVTFSSEYVEAGAKQSSYTLTVSKSRGRIYDRNMNVIAGGAQEYRAAVEPSARSIANLMAHYPESVHGDMEKRLRSGRPYLLDVPDGSGNGEGVTVFKIQKRYSETKSIAPHVVGYLNGEGRGVTGIERAYDNFLSGNSGEKRIRYTVDARGTSLEKEPVITDTTYRSKAGVVLTLDCETQLAVQSALEKHVKSGAAVVMDVRSGEILACASYPAFSQTDVAPFLDDDDSPLLNKAISDYDVGSVFKLVVAAAAIENGMEDFTCECDGCEEIGGRKFYCSSKKGHGMMDMEHAIALSCNSYFIRLGQALGGDKILQKAREMGFGKKIALAGDYFTSGGNLPDEAELSLPAGLANFSFGQGSLMANPVQIAAMVNCIASGGEYVTPKIVIGTVDRYLTQKSTWKTEEKKRVMRKSTAEKLSCCMKATFDYGTGKKLDCFASGKTGTAETGMKKNGRKVKQAWLAGFFPADAPKYTCVVLAENGESGSASAGPVFEEIANALVK